MTVLNFPATTGEPTDGSFQYTENNVTYSWDGTKWTANTADALSDVYLRLDATNDPLTGNLQIGSGNEITLRTNGTADFEGLTTHEAGVSVTGGSAAGVSNGFYGESNRVFVATNGVKYATFGSPSLNNQVAQFGEDVQLATGGVNSLYNLQAILNSTGHGAQDIYNVQSTITADTGSTARVFLFDAKADAQTGAGVNLVGFHTEITQARTPNGNSYSIYCRGDAPSYFRGVIYTAYDVNALPSSSNESGSGAGFLAAGDGGTVSTYSNNNSGSPNAIFTRTNKTDGRIIKFFYSAAAGNGSQTEAGDIRLTSANSISYYPGPSDYRLKQNISLLSNASDVVKQLKPSSYEFINEPGVVHHGFIAHEVKNLVPLSVSGEKDAVDQEGNPEYQTVDQTKLIPILTKALQEALTEIDTLKSRLDALEGA